VEEVARALRVNTKTVYALVKRGEGGLQKNPNLAVCVTEAYVRPRIRDLSAGCASHVHERPCMPQPPPPNMPIALHARLPSASTQ
jgi:hypothetical protein